MTCEEYLLWKKIEEFELDDPDSSLSFSDRLARENRWSFEFSLRCIFEYKKFIFLSCLAPHPLTPSDQVDQVWHLHLIYTRSYWLDFCQNTLGRQIHHGPTKGGIHEQEKFSDWYSKTLIFYNTKFKYSPPPDIWPSSEVRFKKAYFQRVNLDRYWVIKKFF